MERNDGCGVWSNILCANTRLGNAKSSMLQEINPDAACMYCIYARTAFYTYSDQHVLGLVLCAGVITLCCAALCSRYCCRYSITYMIQLLYTGTVYIQNVREETKRSNKAQQQCCIRCSRTCWVSPTLHAQHRTQGTTPHGTARCCDTP